MRSFAEILESYLNNLVEKTFEYKEGYDSYASQIIERLIWHKVLALAAALYLEYNGPKQGKLWNYYEKFSMEHALHEEFYYRKTLQIYELFLDNTIPFYPLKGPFWASMVYPTPLWRHIGDLDLIIPPEKSGPVFDILTSLDMKPITESGANKNNIREYLAARGELAFSTIKQKEFTVEIHEALVTSPRYRKSYSIEIDNFWNSGRTHSWRDIEYMIPPLEEWMLYLALHGACQHQFKRFLSVLDIAHFLDTHGDELDWNRMVKLSHKWGIKKALYFSLRIVNKFKLPGYEIPKTIRLTGPVARLQTWLLSKKTILFGTRERGRFHRKLFRAGIS